MERDIIQKWTESRNISPDDETIEKMIAYAGMIHEANQLFNLTGLKTKEAILSELVIGSIDPLRDIIVPRGTNFIDIGTGAGIPGIALSIFFRDLSGLLIESNHKKAKFVESVISGLELKDVEVLCERAEVAAGNAAFRETFSWCFMRAFGKPYIALELGAPFVKKNGFLYIYAGESFGGLLENTVCHAEKLGLNIMSHVELADFGLAGPGICLRKTAITPKNYPRRFAVIRREAEKAEKIQTE